LFTILLHPAPRNTLFTSTLPFIGMSIIQCNRERQPREQRKSERVDVVSDSEQRATKPESFRVGVKTKDIAKFFTTLLDSSDKAAERLKCVAN